MGPEDGAASPMHRRCQRAEKQARHRAAVPMQGRCGAILRPRLLGPHVGGRRVLALGGLGEQLLLPW
eukprot:1429661-Pyramimonas_sp.AAC.1